MEIARIKERGVQERIELSLLYDFYGALLKDNQQRMFEAYILDDFSVSEIADEMGITRQGVHDAVKRAARQLRDYEQKLGLLARFEQQKSAVKELHEFVKKQEITDDSKEWRHILEMLEQIIE